MLETQAADLQTPRTGEKHKGRSVTKSLVYSTVGSNVPSKLRAAGTSLRTRKNLT